MLVEFLISNFEILIFCIKNKIRKPTITKIIEKNIKISKFDSKNSTSMFLFSLFYKKMLYKF